MRHTGCCEHALKACFTDTVIWVNSLEQKTSLADEISVTDRRTDGLLLRTRANSGGEYRRSKPLTLLRDQVDNGTAHQIWGLENLTPCVFEHCRIREAVHLLITCR